MWLSVRKLLVSLLTVIFLWQAYVAVDKCAERRITTTNEERYQDDFVFPSITFCISTEREEMEGDVGNTDWSFDEEYNAVNAGGVGIVKAFSHRQQGKISMAEYHGGLWGPSNGNGTSTPRGHGDLGSPLDPRWNRSWTRHFSQMHGSTNISACETYTPPPGLLFPGGLAGTAKFYLDTRNVSVVVYIHNDPADLLTPSVIFGSSRFFMPRVAKDYPGPVRTFLFKLKAVDARKMGRDDYPCHKDKVLGMLACVQRSQQKQMGCRLPWKSEASFPGHEICHTKDQLMLYKNLSAKTNNAGPLDIYRQTGCYYGCNYFKFDQELMSQDVTEGEMVQAANYSVRLDMYMVAAAIKIETEKYDYDGYDLVASLGGFMGLLLGWSILSFFDDGKMHVENGWRIVRDWEAKKEWSRWLEETRAAWKSSNTAVVPIKISISSQELHV